VVRRAKRARRQARREHSEPGQDPDDVLAHDDLAREQLALAEPNGSPGLLRRMATHSSGGHPFSVFEEIYAPTRHEANLLMEVQRLVGAPAPAPGDPPFLEPVGPEATADRFRGRVVIRKPPPVDPPIR
jgi:hypothetical protein